MESVELIVAIASCKELTEFRAIIDGADADRID
jgi:hypothetical protein